MSENIGGHRTLHHHLEAALAGRSDIEARFVRVPPPRLARRAVGARWPLLGPLDLDFQPTRAEFAAAVIARRLVRPLIDEADVVHWYTANSALLSLDLLRRKPSVTSLDMTNVLNSQRLPYRYPTRFTPLVTRPVMARERRVYECSRAVIAKSQWAADSVIDDYGIDAAKVHAIPFGILLGPRPTPRPPDRPTLVFVGTTLERKGGFVLLDVWRRALRDRADLVLVTKADVAPEPGLRVIRDVNPGDGRIDEILDTATVFAFPSTMDASPHVVLEAMAHALPVVVRRSGGMPEQIDNGVTGFVVDPDDDEALAAALAKLVDDAHLARQMGWAARLAVEERFDMAKQFDLILDVLRDAAGR